MIPGRTAARLALSLLAAASVRPAAAQGDFFLKDGDRVVFYGDSITDQRLYTTFAETFVVTRYPKRNITFVHSGWGGDRVTGGGGGNVDLRLQRDVIAYKPTVVTVMLGMNDGSYRAFDDKIFSTYAKGYEHIVETLKTALPGVRMTLIQPSPYDDVTREPTFTGGYNAVLLRYSDYLKDLAQKQHLSTADLNNPVVAALRTAKEKSATAAAQIIPDRVHPGAGGHLLMAAALVKAWGATPLVSSVEMDGTSGRVTSAKNTAVSDLKKEADGRLTWTQTDEALPFPVDLKDRVLVFSMESSDFVQTLNQQTLKASGLSAAKYALVIDDQKVGVFTKEELAAGVNLAAMTTPMSQQAAAVHSLTKAHTDLHNYRWRSIEVPFGKAPNVGKALAGLDALEGDLIAQQRAAAQPKPHRFELTPQAG